MDPDAEASRRLDELVRSLDERPDGRAVLEIARAVDAAGGRALLVGGGVRDALLGLPPAKEFDLEVSRLSPEALEGVLRAFGDVIVVGRSFGVFRVKGIGVDVSLPRRDSKSGPGHRGFDVAVDPSMSFTEASRRRDLRMNSMGFDLLTRELLDPHDGRRDIAEGVLRATDARRFADDPLRALRAAQMSARFEMSADAELCALCAELDLSELPGERCYEEFRKLLLKARKPSRGLALLHDTRLLRFFPEIAALVGVPQDPTWHPEGDVWVHTLMVVDVAAGLCTGNERDDAILMFGALCHDFGKPLTTEHVDGRIRSRAHDREGIAPTLRFLERLRAPSALAAAVAATVHYHLAPALLEKGGATEKAYRRLARKLESAGVTMELLCRVARADHLGRTTGEALAGRFPAGDQFLEKAATLRVTHAAEPDVVKGRHLIARGLAPGPQFTEILNACRDHQYETGGTNPQTILDTVLPQLGAGDDELGRNVPKSPKL
ncbi:MAG: HD domain-containing protein [Myxococcales bacterium]|nr:HD domain-containing protein [Myxococcales bacterium]